MEYECEFIYFLTQFKRSSKSGNTFSVRVSRDVVRRCKLVEKSLDLEFSEKHIFDTDGVQKIIQLIKAKKLSSSSASPYGYNDLIHAVRIYCEFLDWKHSARS